LIKTNKLSVYEDNYDDTQSSFAKINFILLACHSDVNEEKTPETNFEGTVFEQ